MEPDEIRAEIERRRKRAGDLRLRELLWSFYRSHLQDLAERLEKDPELVYPEMKEIKIANNDWQFRIGETSYRLVYEEEEATEESGWGGRGRRDETTTTPMKFMLDVDAKSVRVQDGAERYIHSRLAHLQRVHGEYREFYRGDMGRGPSRN